MRDRAQELLDEEESLARTLATTWGADPSAELPRLSLPFDRLLAHTTAGATSVLNAPEGPATPLLAATGFDPVVGDADGLGTRLRSLRDSGFRVVLAADGTGSADRLAAILAEEGIDAGRAHPVRTGNGRDRRGAARARRGAAGRAARGRRRDRPDRPPAHAPPAAPCAAARRLLRGPRARRLRRALPPRRRALRRHGQPRHRRRRARLPAARVQGHPTSCTCRPTRSARSASTPAARRRRSTAWAAPTSRSRRRGSAPRRARSPRSSSCSTGAGSRARATPSRPTRRGSARSRRRSPTRRRPTSSRRSTR